MVAVSSAQASFDLVLVADSGLGVVHRYDGDSGVYLGSFGGGALVNCKSIAVDQLTQRAYVGGANNGAGVGIYNYHTGEFIGYNSSQGTFVRDLAVTASGLVIGSSDDGSGTNLRRLNTVPFGSSVTNFSNGGITFIHTATGEDSTGDLLALNNSNGIMVRWNPANTTTPEATLQDGDLVGGAGGAVRGTEMIVMTQGGRMARLDTQTFTAATLGSTPTSALPAGVDAAFGHTNNAWGLGSNNSVTRLQQYVRTIGGTGSNYDAYGISRVLSQVQTPVGMAVVLAPEPGTMIALGVGVAALLRRRKRQ